MATLSGHKNAVKSYAYSPDGRRIVSAGSDGTLKIWDAGSGNEITTIPTLNDHVEICSFSPDGQRILSTGGYDLHIWDTNIREKNYHTLRA